MSSLNKVILLGRLTRDPELRVTPNGINICKFSIAISRKFKGGDGSIKEETTFIDIDAFGRQAEVISQYFFKGKLILLEGRLKQDQWESQTGEKRSKVGVVLESFQFIGSKEEASEHNNSSNYEAASPPSRSPQVVTKGASLAEDSLDDDVPF